VIEYFKTLLQQLINQLLSWLKSAYLCRLLLFEHKNYLNCFEQQVKAKSRNSLFSFQAKSVRLFLCRVDFENAENAEPIFILTDFFPSF